MDDITTIKAMMAVLECGRIGQAAAIFAAESIAERYRRDFNAERELRGAQLKSDRDPLELEFIDRNEECVL